MTRVVNASTKSAETPFGMSITIFGGRREPPPHTHAGADSVEGFSEGVVVGAECSDDRPDRFELRLTQRRVGVIGIGEEDGDDDGSEGLVLGASDGSADGLDDVDLGAARVDEGDSVEGGDDRYLRRGIGRWSAHRFVRVRCCGAG